MSIGIAAIIPGAAFLVADGRRTYPFVPSRAPEDDVNKISLVHDSLGAIQFGVSDATEPALAAFSQVAQPGQSVCETANQLQASLEFGWNSLVSRLAPDVDTSHAVMRGALIVAGVSRGQPFLAGSMQSFSPPDPVTVRTDLYSFLVLGGESQNAQFDFARGAQRFVQRRSPNQSVFEPSVFQGFLEAAGRTIRRISQLEPTVGGTIRYALFRANAPAETGTWTG